MPLLHPNLPRTLSRLGVQHTRKLFTKSPPVTQRSPVRTGVYAAAWIVSAGLFTVYYFDSRSALHRYVLTPIVRNLFDAETGHKLAVKTLRSGLSPRDIVPDDERLKTEVWGEQVSNPIGLAAGFDKDGEGIDGLFNLGFSWVEIGSVTPKPQDGNSKPRMFRLEEDGAVINRYGFPSQGAIAVLNRLRARIPSFGLHTERAALRDDAILAVNLGKNKESSPDSVDDFLAGVHTFGPYADVLVVNVSSPNTPGLRGLQNKEVLEVLLSRVAKARDELPTSPLRPTKPKVVLKIAPDLDEAQIVDMAEVIRKSDIDGVIVSNTTIQRPKTLVSANKTETGGLSGPPVKAYSMKALQTLRGQLPASIPIIGCGGISSGKDALDYAKAGAAMVQLYTSFGYDGVGTCRRIKDELVDELAKEGKTWGQVSKEAIERLSWKAPPPETRDLQQLVAEAEELKVLLDRLGEKIINGVE